MLSAIVSYVIYLIASAVLLAIFFFIYTKVTPFDELALIQAGKGAAALSLGGALVGFSLTLGSAIVHNAGAFAVISWAIGAMVVQIVVYAIATRLWEPMRTQLEAGNVAMGGFMGTISLVAGIVNAACLS